MQEMQVGFLAWKDHLEKEMSTPLQYFAWRIPWTEEPGGLQSVGVAKESDTTEQLNTHTGTI